MKMKMAAWLCRSATTIATRRGGQYSDRAIKPHCGCARRSANQGQPTRFEVERHWGVFTVTVPADHEGEIAWHLENQGKVFHVPANLDADYIIDAIVGDAERQFAA